MPNRQVAREISYASSAQTKGGRAVIRVLENATGRLGLIKRAAGYEHDVAAGRDFWQVMVERYGLSLNVVGGSMENIPKTGPLILIANHPYGILDGLIIGHILNHVRGDFRILANSVFKRAEELNRILLPVSFDETKEAVRQNIETRKRSLEYLAEGGAIGVFPGGTVATAAKPFSRPMDPGWRGFTARMVAKSGATVLPIYFDGHNSRLFQVASHLHYTLRMALLIREFKARVDEPVDIAIGTPIDPVALAERAGDTHAMMDFLRQETYALSPKPLKSLDYGFEFEERYKS
ncbi:lysophospholipid acyltransferase family protein [Actibacterium sp. 188UL27-1]|uniref:lysophospholipid acyltransferase family protein n=1 Tax=Actibacterium sp. 188UL27-1 TaxID=2786961 RepID=UPI001958BEC9|nr:lysophospholipid acyltransferase family protein [Actibacterium sp. 188UL27-1]MBM7067668.1 lysophospholipid acyltransferase family protein [Actibacterium sp. 188UL27-1]